ncbi:MAG TPA: hypothetical protein VJ938_13740 [Acidimicrobiia bacterium]|nr:hypothetical protein [Acidimicrobiia bacterium]
MYRLGDLTEEQRSRYGWALLLVGTVALALAVLIVHYANFPETHFVDGVEEPLVLGQFNWMPRGWLPKGIGYLIAFGASQMLIVGAVLAFILGRPMTWARATFGAFLVWIEFVIIFGIVPSEWLNLAQTDLDWSNQRVALTLPPWLVLGNEVEISWAVVKDGISMGYNLTVLVAAIIFAYKIQDIEGSRPAESDQPERVSPYGRPLVRGDA